MVPLLPGALGVGPEGVLSPQGLAAAATSAPFLSLEGERRDAPQGFAAVLGNLVEDARSKDIEAQRAVESFARLGDPGRIHETMVAVSKAEVALRTVASVRNKLLEAYRDLQHVTA